MGIFRPSVTLYLVWLLLTTWWMRRGSLMANGGSVEAAQA
jgi:hypothetical protein